MMDGRGSLYLHIVDSCDNKMHVLKKYNNTPSEQFWHLGPLSKPVGKIDTAKSMTASTPGFIQALQ